jgi:hypothetical protein
LQERSDAHHTWTAAQEIVVEFRERRYFTERKKARDVWRWQRHVRERFVEHSHGWEREHDQRRARVLIGALKETNVDTSDQPQRFRFHATGGVFGLVKRVQSPAAQVGLLELLLEHVLLVEPAQPQRRHGVRIVEIHFVGMPKRQRIPWFSTHFSQINPTWLKLS